MIRVIVAGGRKFDDRDYLFETLSGLARGVWKGRPICVVSGGARGADSLGEAWVSKAAGYGFTASTKVYPADWEAHGRAAGPIRNKEMAANADACVCFWDGKSPGTKSMISEALKARLELHVFMVKPRE